MYTKEQVLDLIYAIDQGINPEIYESSKNLNSSDFMDLAVCKAKELGLRKELDDYREKNKVKSE